MKKELSQLEAEKANLEKSGEIKEAKEFIKQNDPGNSLKGYSDKDFDAWKDKAEDNFEKGREARFKKYRTKPDTKSLDDAKNQIIRKLMEAKKKDKGGLDANLSVEDMDSINSTAEALMKNISLGVARGKDFSSNSQEELITKQLNLGKDGYNHLFKGTNEFDKITQNYKNLQNQSYVASDYEYARAFNTTKNTTIVDDDITKRDIRRYENSHPKPKKRVSSSKSSS